LVERTVKGTQTPARVKRDGKNYAGSKTFLSVAEGGNGQRKAVGDKKELRTSLGRRRANVERGCALEEKQPWN